MTFAEFLILWRKRAGLTQEQASVVAGTSRQTMNGWERGRGSPRRSVLIALLDCYGVPNEERGWLLDGAS